MLRLERSLNGIAWRIVGQQGDLVASCVSSAANFHRVARIGKEAIENAPPELRAEFEREYVLACMREVED